MKMAKKLILATVMFPIALGTASAFAADGDKGGKKGAPKRPPMPKCEPGLSLNPGIIKRLDLTDAQKQQLKEIRKADRADMKAKKEAHEKRMNALLLADTFDKAKAEAMIKEGQDSRVDRQVHKLEQQFKMLSVLTPAQKAKLVEMEKKHPQQCGAPMQPGMDKQHKKGE